MKFVDDDDDDDDDVTATCYFLYQRVTVKSYERVTRRFADKPVVRC